MTDPTATAPPLIVLCGPTATGKTALSLQLAQWMEVEVISADSRQVYLGMDVGTAKVTQQERSLVPHHLIDLIAPDESFSVSRFVEMAESVARGIQSRNCTTLVVGGTGLYIRGLTEGLLDAPSADEPLRLELQQRESRGGPGTLHKMLTRVDPESAASIHPNNLVKIVRALEVYAQSGRPISALQKEHGFAQKKYPLLKLGLFLPQEQHETLMLRRTEAMFAQGLLDETEALLRRGYEPETSALRTLGYHEAVAVLRGRMKVEEAISKVYVRTRQYAKRQMTWFKKDPEIIWVDSCREFVKIRSFIGNFMQI